MERQIVRSSTIASIGYEAATGVLEIEFVNGSVYEYTAVPPRLADGLLKASSCGSYFAKNIKDSGYRVRWGAGRTRAAAREPSGRAERSLLGRSHSGLPHGRGLWQG